MADTQTIEKPRGLTMRAGTWTVDKWINGIRVYKALDTTDLAEAIERMNQIVLKRTALSADAVWRKKVLGQFADQQSWLHKTHARLVIRGRASQKGCTLTPSEFAALMMRSNGRCEVTGVPFSDTVPPGARIAPFRESVDRIDSSLGYHVDNCRLVCLAVNLAMRDWGEDVMHRIAKAMLYKHLKDETERAE